MMSEGQRHGRACAQLLRKGRVPSLRPARLPHAMPVPPAGSAPSLSRPGSGWQRKRTSSTEKKGAIPHGDSPSIRDNPRSSRSASPTAVLRTPRPRVLLFRLPPGHPLTRFVRGHKYGDSGGGPVGSQYSLQNPEEVVTMSRLTYARSLTSQRGLVIMIRWRAICMPS